MKLLCKKTAIIFEASGWGIATGKYYTFEKFVCEPNIYKLLIDDEGEWWYFNLYWEPCIWDYFYTPQEIRKMKLQKIEPQITMNPRLR